MYFPNLNVNKSSVIVLAFMTILLYYCTYYKVSCYGHVPNENKSVHTVFCTHSVISAS